MDNTIDNIDKLKINYKKNRELVLIIDLCFTTICNLSFNEFIEKYNGDKPIIYSDLVKKNKELEEDIKELKTNYWNLHKHYIK